MKIFLPLISLIFSTMFASYCNGQCTFIHQADTTNNLIIYFTYGGSSGALSYNWDFGDSAGTSQLQNPYYNYSVPGNYMVNLYTIDSIGDTCSYSEMISVGSSVVCNFMFSAPGTAPATVTFNDASTGPVVSYFWDFGDGSSATITNPSHMYVAPGIYSACLTTTDTVGLTCTICMDVIVNAPCSASFQYATTGLTAFMVENSINTNLQAMNYQWNFGDGATSTTRYPSHTYSAPGSYNVCLNITDNATCFEMVCQTVSVDTLTLVGCMAEFLFTETQPYSIAIVNTSFGWGPSYLWDFGDGATSNLEFPTHTYTSTGTYNICLEVSDTTGCINTFCDSLTVDSLGNITSRTAGFTVTVIPPSDLSVSVSETKPLNISGYPNPVKNCFTIDIQDVDSERRFVLYSLLGKVCSSGRLTAGKNLIDMMDLPTGMYFLELSNEVVDVKCWKLIKE